MSYPRGAVGHARVSARSPQAWGICDRDGQRYLRSELTEQHEWQGRQLVNLGILVCRRCLDVPQPQLYQYAPPPDPVPVYQARPDLFPTSGNMGFTPYNLLWPNVPGGAGGGIGQFIIGVSAIGAGTSPGNPVAVPWPTTDGAAQAALAAQSGIATPLLLNDYTQTVTLPNVAVTVVPANPARSWLAIYSPGGLFVFSTGTAAIGSQTSATIDPGLCYFWATAQGNGAVYTGALSVAALQGGAQIMAWDA
jgi:hypothetical protein